MYESDNNIRKGQGNGYRSEDGTICMIRCFHCGQENYAPAVSSGQCAWCGKHGEEEVCETSKTKL